MEHLSVRWATQYYGCMCSILIITGTMGNHDPPVMRNRYNFPRAAENRHSSLLTLCLTSVSVVFSSYRAPQSSLWVAMARKKGNSILDQFMAHPTPTIESLAVLKVRP